MVSISSVVVVKYELLMVVETKVTVSVNVSFATVVVAVVVENSSVTTVDVREI